MAYTTFEEAWQKAPEEIQDFLADNAYKFADKYLTLFERSEDYTLFFELIIFLQKIGVKHYEIPNLYTLQYLIENVLNLDKEFAQKLAEVIWNDFIPTVKKVWQGEETPEVVLPEKEERLQKAILAQIEKEATGEQVRETASSQDKEFKEKIESTEETKEKPEEKIQKAETTIEATKEKEVEASATEEKSTEKKIPIETTEKEVEETTAKKSPESIPIVEVPTISWSGVETEEEIKKEPEIIIEEKEKLTEKTESEGPIDVSSY